MPRLSLDVCERVTLPRGESRHVSAPWANAGVRRRGGDSSSQQRTPLQFALTRTAPENSPHRRMSFPTNSRQVAAESCSASLDPLCSWRMAHRTGLPVAWSRCSQRREIRHAASVISNQHTTPCRQVHLRGNSSGFLRASCFSTSLIRTPAQENLAPVFIRSKIASSPSRLMPVRLLRSITSLRPPSSRLALLQLLRSSATQGPTSVPSTTSVRRDGLSTIEIL